MEVKGTAVISTREFVKTNFGEQNLNKWILSLDDQTKKIYESAILTNNWYPMEHALRKPAKKWGNVLWRRLKKARDAGMYSADYGKGHIQAVCKNGVSQVYNKQGRFNFFNLL